MCCAIISALLLRGIILSHPVSLMFLSGEALADVAEMGSMDEKPVKRKECQIDRGITEEPCKRFEATGNVSCWAYTFSPARIIVSSLPASFPPRSRLYSGLCPAALSIVRVTK